MRRICRHRRVGLVACGLGLFVFGGGFEPVSVYGASPASEGDEVTTAPADTGAVREGSRREGRRRGGGWMKEDFPGGPGPGPGGGPGFMRGHGPGLGEDEGPWGRRAMDEDEIDELMSFVEQHLPDLYETLDRARTLDPMAFRHMLRRVRGMMDRFRFADPKIRETMIAEYKVKMAIRRLKKDYYRATSEERESIKVELRAQIEKQFTYRQQRLVQEIARLRERLDEQSRRLAEQEKDKQRLIDEELSEMLDGLKDRVHSRERGRHREHQRGDGR